jgi:biopolymer transport protein ExbB
VNIFYSALTAIVAQTQPPPASTPPSMEVKSVFDFVDKGGPVMIPIILCSLVALAIIAERLIALRRSKIIPPQFIPGLKGVFRDVRTDRDAALTYCRADQSPIAAVTAVGIKRLGEPVDLLERHIAEAGERQVQRLRARLRLLSIIASVAPLLGLLGTITGMITAFQTVALSAEALGKTEMLAKGIYEAMITTAAGLIVAIPVLLAYNWIASIIERRVSEIDTLAADFVEEYALNAGSRTSPLGVVAPAPRVSTLLSPYPPSDIPHPTSNGQHVTVVSSAAVQPPAPEVPT